MRKKKIAPMDRTRDQVLTERFMSPYCNLPIERILQWVRGQRVILCRIRGKAAIPTCSHPLGKLAAEDASRYHGRAFVLKEPWNRWTELGQEPTASFNCHSYSFGDRVGITPEDWVEGEWTDMALNTNPAEILFSAYFKPIKVLPPCAGSSLVFDRTLKDGDVISFTKQRLGWGTNYMHSGIVQCLGEENWLVSKFSSGRLIAAPIPEIAEVYLECGLERIGVHRFRG